MIDVSQIQLERLVVHLVGSAMQGESLTLSKHEITGLNEDLQNVLTNYFMQSFRHEALYTFTHHNNLDLNEIYYASKNIFADPSALLKSSGDIAKHLYQCAQHPKISGGELYVAYFSHAVIEDEVVEVIGIFKSDQKSTFIKVALEGDRPQLILDKGSDLNKLNKGALIINTMAGDGYMISLVDNLGRGFDAQYWKDDFLKVTPLNTSFHQTYNYLNLCKGFVKDKIEEELPISKADKIDLLNRSLDFFKSKKAFDQAEYNEKVLQDPKYVDLFESYKADREVELGSLYEDTFDINETAVKQQGRIFKSVLKLDKNFHIYIHGNRTFIEKGYDQTKNLNYYKLYYREEN